MSTHGTQRTVSTREIGRRASCCPRRHTLATVCCERTPPLTPPTIGSLLSNAGHVTSLNGPLGSTSCSWAGCGRTAVKNNSSGSSGSGSHTSSARSICDEVAHSSILTKNGTSSILLSMAANAGARAVWVAVGSENTPSRDCFWPNSRYTTRSSPAF
jgi:hypothetical protein